jgi:hypothetical protein
MNLSNPQLDQALRADPALAEAVEELTARLKAGEAVDLDAWLAERPVYADELRRLFPMLRLLAELSRSGEASAPAIPPDEVASGRLGDFRLVREIGKGGMGGWQKLWQETGKRFDFKRRRRLDARCVMTPQGDKLALPHGGT